MDPLSDGFHTPSETMRKPSGGNRGNHQGNCMETARETEHGNRETIPYRGGAMVSSPSRARPQRTASPRSRSASLSPSASLAGAHASSDQRTAAAPSRQTSGRAEKGGENLHVATCAVTRALRRWRGRVHASTRGQSGRQMAGPDMQTGAAQRKTANPPMRCASMRMWLGTSLGTSEPAVTYYAHCHLVTPADPAASKSAATACRRKIVPKVLVRVAYQTL